jgi:nucleoside-diphosphate-sugar epimerase
VRLLVTGASGLIGRHIAALAATRPDVELILTGRARPAGLAPSVEFSPADLSDAGQAAELVDRVRPTHLIHTAWETRQPTYWESMSNLDWVVSAARMAEAFAAVGGTRFVQLGTCAEYDWADGLCIEGSTPDKPTTRYGMAKLAGFRAVQVAAHGNFHAVEARVFFVYGPGENPARLIPLICRSHLAGTVPQLSSGIQKRDLLFVEDAAEAILALARHDSSWDVVNISATEPVALSQAATVLAELAGSSETGLSLRPDRADDPPLLIGESSRIRATGWQPRHSLEQGLAKTFHWWRESMAKAARDESA